MRKTGFIFTFVCALFLFCACNNQQPRLNSTDVTLYPGQTYALSISAGAENIEACTVNWISSDSNVVTVDNGLLTGINNGTAKISANIWLHEKEQTLTCTITVTDAPATIQNISLNEDLTMESGQTAALTPKYTPEHATASNLIWTTSNPAVATVTDGAVTAIAEGTATITASLPDNIQISDSITVTVLPDSRLNELTIRKSLSLNVGQAYTLTATTDSEPYTGNIVWSSTNTDVASVSAGSVTANAEGTAVIKAEAGGKTATCTITVTQNITVQLDQSTVTAIDGKTKTLQFSATVTPASKNIGGKWSVSDPYYAQVNESGLVTLKPLPEGSEFDYVKIQVTYTVEGAADSCDIIMVRNSDVNDVIINGQNLTLPTGQTHTLTYTVIPEGADGEFIWESDNTNVATVQNGVVTAQAPGIARISIRLKENPDIISRIKITVQ